MNGAEGDPGDWATSNRRSSCTLTPPLRRHCRYRPAPGAHPHRIARGADPYSVAAAVAVVVVVAAVVVTAAALVAASFSTSSFPLSSPSPSASALN